MRGKTLTNEKARAVVEARRAGQDPKLLGSDFGSVGGGDYWDESKADDAAEPLEGLKSHLLEEGARLDVNTFDKAACVIVHRELGLPAQLVADEGFWRWLAVTKFGEIVEERALTKPAHLRNYGIDASVTANRIAILWFRANMAYDHDADDPYHLASQLSHTDFWESSIIRHRYGWAPNLARSLVKFQYRDPSSPQAFLHSTHVLGIRELYKRLRRLHTTIAFEYLDDDELWAILEEKTADLRRA